jgi:hypothetical protein
MSGGGEQASERSRFPTDLTRTLRELEARGDSIGGGGSSSKDGGREGNGAMCGGRDEEEEE